MSSYKSYTPRRATESTESSTNDKLRDKVEKLQELFPTWSSEDLQSVLTETAGVVELAVARISEGHAEQWGSVTRKKEKKNSQPSQSTSSFPPRGDRDRPSGDVRGGRGGRGGRGRGGSRGASRGAHAPNYHRDPGTSVAGTNGHGGPANDTTMANNDLRTDVCANTTMPNNDRSTESKANGTGADEAWGTKTTTAESNEATPDGWIASADTPAVGSTAGWGAEPIAEKSPAPAWPTDTGPTDNWGTAAVSPQNGTSDIAIPKLPVKTSKIPPGSKLSWAQIARAQEKPKSTPTSAPAPTLPVAPPAPSAAPESPRVSPPEDTPLPQDQQEGWEEPTTVQPPTWDDEPPSLPTQLSESQVSSHDGWITADNVPPPAPAREAWDTTPFSAPSRELSAQDPNWSQSQREEQTSVSSPQITTPSTTSIAQTSFPPSVATSIAPTSKPSTPSVAHSSARPGNAHRNSARYPKSDQAVVIPAFAGSIGAGGEKLGMQFGSLSIGGEDNFDGSFKPEAEQPTTSGVPEPHQAPPPQQTPASVHDVVQSPVAPASSHGQHFFQQQPESAPSVSTQQHQIHPPPPPSQPQQQATPSGPPFGSHQPPPALNHQHQQLAQHHQQQPQHSYTQQHHGLHAHFDGPPAPQPQQPQQQPQPQQPQQQHTSGPQSSSYFRQPETPYYHNPTPPQSTAPEHPGAYATTFSPLGAGAGAQGLGQAQGGHLGGFGGGGPGEYGYGDGQRGFYDYAQPGSFSNRLVHDEPSKGGLPISQSNQPSSLGSAAGQPQASSGPQSASGQPTAGQQGQQQGYPAPMPYYYPPYYPQNSYPTYPNPSYGQAYMPKYPPVYPHQAPVGPGSGPPPAGKGPTTTAPYNASASQNHLYHGQSGFEDPSAGYQHHQGSTNLSTADYQKQPPHHQPQQPLYAGQAGQGLQSFLGIQQTAGSAQGVGGPGAQQRTGTSPETAYKPYGAPGGASDKSGVGIGGQAGPQGRSAGVQQSQQQTGGAGSFYPGGGRFSVAGGGPQQQGQQQQGQGYPQGGDQGQFYPYQPRHQGAYWQ